MGIGPRLAIPLPLAAHVIAERARPSAEPLASLCPQHFAGSVFDTMPKGRERAGVRGHGGQRGERGSYRNAWAEGDYSRQGVVAGSDSDEDAAHSPNVRARLAHWGCAPFIWLPSLGLPPCVSTHTLSSHRKHGRRPAMGARQRCCARGAVSKTCTAERAGRLPRTAPRREVASTSRRSQSCWRYLGQRERRGCRSDTA